MRKICTFMIGGIRFGIDVLKVMSILHNIEIIRVPLAGKAVKGIIQHRGHIITVIDLRKKFELPDWEKGKIPLHAIIKTKKGAFSFLVDEVGEIQEIQQNTKVEIGKNIQEIDGFYVSHSYKLDDSILLILDAEKVVEVKSELSV